MTLRNAMIGVIPPKVAMRLRAEKNRRNLFGLGAPARVLIDLIPRGRVAIDAGANAGLYAYWIAQAASHVHAFEPQADVFRRLKATVPKNVTTYNVALSDHNGEAVLHVPACGGEATLRELEVETSSATVPLRSLDSFHLVDVGFMKVDVEGHEEELLRGGAVLLAEQQPVIFVEIEERHNRGGLQRVQEFLQDLGYTEASYMRQGRLFPLSGFNLNAHQIDRRPGSWDYVNNFVFRA